MKSGKLELLEQIYKHLIDYLSEDSYVMVGRFGSGCEWLTAKPELCTHSQKANLQGLFKKAPEPKSNMNFLALLQSAYSGDFPEIEFPRSVIVLSNGNFTNQRVIEDAVMDLAAKESKYSVRVSCLGVGSGASDSLLRTISTKCHGIMQVVTSSSQIKERTEFFTKHLRAKCITNVSLTYDPEVIAMLLPTFKPTDKILKSTPFELFFYVHPKNAKSKTAIKLGYFDEEDKTQKEITITADLQPHASEEKSDLHKIVMNRLLLESHRLRKGELDTKLKELIGEDNWPLKLAIQHQIFTPETAYLAIAHDLPDGFDQLTGDLDAIQTANPENKEVQHVVVKQVIANDYLKKANNAPEKIGLQQLIESKATPPSLGWMKNRFAQERTNKAYSIGGSSKSGANATRDKDASRIGRDKPDPSRSGGESRSDPSLRSIDFTSIWQQGVSDSEDEELELDDQEFVAPGGHRSRFGSETKVLVPPAANPEMAHKGSFGAIPTLSGIGGSLLNSRGGGSDRHIQGDMKDLPEVRRLEIETTEASPDKTIIGTVGPEIKVFKLQPVRVKDMIPTLLTQQEKSGKWCYTVELLKLFSVSEEKITMFSKATNLPFDAIVTLLAIHAIDLSKIISKEVKEAKDRAMKAVLAMKVPAQSYKRIIESILKELTPVFA